jgi:pyruvate dehydrogenase E1 component alpha subunit
MGTPLSRSLSVPDVSQKALAYGMARDRFEGYDVLKVRDRVAEAIKRARYNSEPTLIEILCYRFRGHSMSDPGLYRSKDEIEEFKKRDCLTIAKQYLSQWGVEEKELEGMEESVHQEIEDSLKFAEESPVLPAERLEEFNYVE